MKTAITDSSKYSKCLIRGRQVVLTPEERVRQRLLHHMVDELGYPKGLLSVEKQIGERRYDLVCYLPSMSPLLLVECKADLINEMAERQAFGYNATVKAPFICLVNADEIKTLWLEREEVKFVPFLPPYEQLRHIVHSRL